MGDVNIENFFPHKVKFYYLFFNKQIGAQARPAFKSISYLVWQLAI